MKKHLALVLALVMVLSSFSFVSAAPDFSDMEGHENAEAVARLELLNVLKGYPDGTFKPENTITRAEFAAVAVRVSGLENVAMAAQGLPTGFTDVPAWHWASGYVGTAAKMGIVNGIGNGLFAPETPVKYEEAITMIVRALGYEPMAQARGGYPFGYLIVANEIELLEDAMGTQGTWATRGFVAQITDNALEIPMMIQVGFGSDTKWVVSGEEDTTEKWLLGQMGFKSYEAVVEDVDVSDLEIRVDGRDSDMDGWYNVSANFNFFAAKDATIKMWVDGDDLLVYSMVDDVYFDAVDANSAGDEVTLKVEGDKFDVDGFEASDLDFAKVIVSDEEGEVVQIDNLSFEGFILVDEVDDEMITDLNDDELDIEDYAILKDGKMISSEDIEEGDLVFYLDEEVLDGEYEGLAVVYNNSEVGVVERVYTSGSFRLDGTTYDQVEDYDALYLDEGDLDVLTVDILEGMMDEESEVEVFMDFDGDVALVSGETGVAKTSSFYAVVIDETGMWSGRGGDQYYNLDVLNEFGEEAEYDVRDYFTENEKSNGDALTGDDRTFVDEMNGDAWGTAITTGALVELTVDEDGDLEKVVKVKTEVLEAIPAANTGFEIDDTWAEVNKKDARLQSSTVIFYDLDGAEFKKVINLGDVDDEFFEVTSGSAVVVNGRVEAVLAVETDADTDTTEYTGLVTDVEGIRDGEFEITIEVAGVEMTFDTNDTVFPASTDAEDLENDVWTLVVGDESKEIDKVETVTTDTFIVHAIKDDVITATGGAIVADGEKVEGTNDAVVYEKDGTSYDDYDFRDINVGDTVRVVFEGSSEYWVSYVLVESKASTGSNGDVNDVYLEDAYQLGVDGGQIYVVIDGVTYMYGGSQTLSELENLESDTVPVIVTMVNGIVTEIAPDTEA